MPSESPQPALVESAQRVSTSFSDLQTSVRGTQPKVVQIFLTKAHQSITKRFSKTQAYLALASGIAREQLAQHPHGKLSQSMLHDVKTTALQVAKAWNTLYSRAKYGKPIFTLFSKPLRVLPVFDVPESQWGDYRRVPFPCLF
jgi:hypothetical protein